LKTPLQTIISSIDLLVKRMTEQRDADVILEEIQRLSSSAERMVAQMDDLTDYARLGAGKLEPRRIEFNPGELIERVVDEFQEQALRSGLDLVVRRKKMLLLVASDARKIEQIAANLITNAIKYTPSGHIQVSMEMASSGVEGLHLIVEDTGGGGDHEKLHTLFEPFTQLDQGTSRKYDSAGMGLAIVRKLVDLFGGTIEVRSDIGRVTRFDVVLPVEIIASEAPPLEPTHASEPKRRHVLLVDRQQCRGPGVDEGHPDRDRLCVRRGRRRQDRLAEAVNPFLRRHFARHPHAGHGRLRSGGRRARRPGAATGTSPSSGSAPMCRIRARRSNGDISPATLATLSGWRHCAM
jgi:two-component sensor histidine kinase